MSDWTELILNGTRWRVLTTWREPLLDRSGLRLAEWQAAGVLETLKSAPHRTIYRACLDGRMIYVKHYPVPDLRARLRQLFRPAKAQGEFDRAQALAALNLPTIEPLAVGVAPSGESYLVTRGLEPCQPLNTFIEKTVPTLPASRRYHLRLRLADRLAELLARMHSLGVRHLDLHAGNLLVQEQDGDVRLCLIDLHAVRFGLPLNWRHSRDNLVVINRWFVQRSSRADRRRFWDLYVRQRTDWQVTKAEERRRAKELETRTWESCLQFWRNRDRRCRTSNRYFYRLRRGANQGWAVRDLPPEVLQELLAQPDRPLQPATCRILKHSRSSTVGELTLNVSTDVMKEVIYKRFSVTKWSDPWLALARDTPALRSWVNGHRLLECGLPTARPLAVIHRRRLGLTHECYLVAEKLPGTVELHKYLASLDALPAPERRQWLLSLLDQVARLVRALHLRQLGHRDLKAANLLVAPAEKVKPIGVLSPHGPQLYLIDLVGLERWRKLPHSRQVQNLARLNTSFHDHPYLSRMDRLRFLRTYMAWGLHGKAGWKELWREIAQATQAKIAQNQRRGRPLS